MVGVSGNILTLGERYSHDNRSKKIRIGKQILELDSEAELVRIKMLLHEDDYVFSDENKKELDRRD